VTGCGFQRQGVGQIRPVLCRIRVVLTATGRRLGGPPGQAAAVRQLDQSRPR
jgi:hypothetical protein